MASVLGIGQPRVDGPLKVSGRATYASDHHFPGMVYGVPVCSTIARGEIRSTDTSAEERMPGLLAISHRANIGKLFRAVGNSSFGANMVKVDEKRAPFEDDTIRYYGQYVALAVAGTFEQAVAAADAVKVAYREDKPNGDGKLAPEIKQKGESERGDAAKAFAAAEIQGDEGHRLPPGTPNPIQ